MSNVTDYASVKQIADRNPAFSEGRLRWILFNAATNGLAESGAVIRIGGRVLIHEPRFCRWLESHGEAGAR